MKHSLENDFIESFNSTKRSDIDKAIEEVSKKHKLTIRQVKARLKNIIRNITDGNSII